MEFGCLKSNTVSEDCESGLISFVLGIHVLDEDLTSESYYYVKSSKTIMRQETCLKFLSRSEDITSSSAAYPLLYRSLMRDG